jgi:glutamyl-tRNA synthetase
VTVRLRFAPSPTGELHIGSVRTTLYNFLFAKQNGGQLVLRIEDTDQARFDARALPSIYDGLRWLGITWDEGPREGGPHAPYVQSERLPLYHEHAEKLVEMDAAYYCFCSPERLAQVRATQQARGDPVTRYDRFCRKIDAQQAADRATREPHTVRLKVPESGTVGIDDLVHGPIEWQLETIEDQVLLKTDGFPTYHLAVVVDDHVMGMTHILRGEEWLPSVPKHLVIYRALGWQVPPMGHVPLVLGPDGKKLSKRHGATRVTEFRDQGFLPDGLINYLALVGWAPGTEDEIFSMDDLIRVWRSEQVQKAGGKWDYQRLRWFSGVWMRRLSDDELLRRLDPFLPADWDRGVVRAAIPIIKERMEILTQAKDLIAFLFTDALPNDPASLLPKKRTPVETRDAVTRVRSALASLDGGFDKPAIQAALEKVAADMGWKQGDVNMAVRLAVTGTNVGPPIYESIELLGRDRALARLDRAAAALEGTS